MRYTTLCLYIVGLLGPSLPASALSLGNEVIGHPFKMTGQTIEGQNACSPHAGLHKIEIGKSQLIIRWNGFPGPGTGDTRYDYEVRVLDLDGDHSLTVTLNDPWHQSSTVHTYRRADSDPTPYRDFLAEELRFFQGVHDGAGCNPPTPNVQDIVDFLATLQR